MSIADLPIDVQGHMFAPFGAEGLSCLGCAAGPDGLAAEMPCPDAGELAEAAAVQGFLDRHGLQATLARYGPGSPWSTHRWVDDPYWGDSCSFCADCDTVSYRDAAHEPCPGAPDPDRSQLSAATLVKPRVRP